MIKKSHDLPQFHIVKKLNNDEYLMRLSMPKVQIDYDISNTTRLAILDCCRIVKRYLHDCDIESDDCFAEMIDRIELNRISIPESVFEPFEDYVTDAILPMVYDSEVDYDIIDIEAKFDNFVMDNLYPLLVS